MEIINRNRGETEVKIKRQVHVLVGVVPYLYMCI